MNETLTPKQRFLTVLAGGQPDRVPLFDFLFSQNLYEHILGHKPETYNSEDAIALTNALALDGVQIAAGAADTFQTIMPTPDTLIGEWGTTQKIDTTVSWPTGGPSDHPVRNRSDWRNYEVPDPFAKGRMTPVKTAVELGGGHLAIIGSVSGPYSHGSWITGLDAMSLMFYDDPALAHEILDAIAEWDIAIGQQMVETGVDVLLLAEDMGANQGPLMSMAHFREFVLPYFDKVVRAFRKTGVPVIMHNDGRIWNFLDDLVATGISAYHPIERSAGMDLGVVKQKYGRHICPIGNVDNKGILRKGTVTEVEQEVISCLRLAGSGGGYILASDHSLNDSQKIENIIAMFEAAKKYGSYPLNLPIKE
jgi:uroporphyrinogen decarboxylase